MIENIDQAIVGLLALRHLIDAGPRHPKPWCWTAVGAGHLRRFRWPWQFNALRPVGLWQVGPDRRGADRPAGYC